MPEPSACIDGFRSRKGSIPKNHSDMCRFASEQDIGYKRIVSFIQDFIDLVLEDRAKSKSTNLTANGGDLTFDN